MCWFGQLEKFAIKLARSLVSTMSYKLYYFNARGGAEATRIIFAQAGVKYEDVRFQGEQWAKEYKEGKMILAFP